MSSIFKIAYQPTTNQFIHIEQASNGLSCNCICLKCDERLEAIQGEIRIKHFRHHTNLNCEGSQETALHELGKQILVENLQIAIPGHGVIAYSNAVAEKRLEKIRPDVTAIFEGKPIYFEIFVSHAVDSGKEKIFKLGKHRSVEIDLRNCTTTSFEEIKRIVLEEIRNKKVFYWQEEVLIESSFAINETINQVSQKWTFGNWVEKNLPCIIPILIFIGIVHLISR